MRNLGLNRVAEENLKFLDEDVKELIISYANGINEYVQSAFLLPLEYYILRAEFRPWTPKDTLAFNKLISFRLTFDWAFEYTRSLLATNIGEDLAE